jgi:LmbE family N-acetylglucosaminyl deacetylase
MSCGRLLLALAVAACGAGPALPRSHDLVIVAHEDDDLLFMQPDVWNAIRLHQPVTVVYVTAGDAGHGVDYAESRIFASKAAYGQVSGLQDWHCRWIELAGHAAQRCDLPAGNVSLVFLGYPDGGIPGNQPSSLLHLWEGTIDHADTVARRVARYDRAGLIAALSEIITFTRPSTIRTLEVSATHGSDHSDHMLVGSLAVLAAARAGTDAAFVSYRGYNVISEPPNNPEVIYDQVSLGMRAYEACQLGCASCGDAACDQLSNSWYAALLHRHYAIAMRQPPMSGLLQTAGGCVTVDGSAVTLGDCARGTTLSFESHGMIRAGARCLRLARRGRLVAVPCRGGAEEYFLLDDEGHLWTGVPPAPGPAMDTNHTMCLIGDAGGVRAAVCGQSSAPQWVLGGSPAVSLRSQLGITAHGRSVQLADLTGDGLADLCRIEGGGLWCARGDGTGRFLDSVRIDAVDHPLAIDPQSLMLGDLDGDGLIDACGRSAQGILCATAADLYAAKLWSPAFGGGLAAAVEDRALAIVDGTVCGMTAGGVACASQGGPPVARSAWPASGATLWPADLDGDAVADWCMPTAAGPRCGLDADRAVTADGAPWGFAFHTLVEGSVASDGAVADQMHGAVADISGDGRADLCVVIGSNVECALSQGHGFGPRFPVLTLPASSTAEALWLGDLDGDGKADPCVDDGTSIFCTLSP